MLSADVLKFETAMSQLQKSPLVAKPGQRWEPTRDNVDEYLTRCDEICRLVPQDFNELQCKSQIFFHITYSIAAASKSCMQLMQLSCAL